MACASLKSGTGMSLAKARRLGRQPRYDRNGFSALKLLPSSKAIWQTTAAIFQSHLADHRPPSSGLIVDFDALALFLREARGEDRRELLRVPLSGADPRYRCLLGPGDGEAVWS